MSSDDLDRPSLSEFDLSEVREPDDGILYLYRSANDGFWRVVSDADMALQEATGYPVGEIQELEAFSDEDVYTEGEYGEIIAIFVDDPRREHSKLEVEDPEHCKKCGAELPTDKFTIYDAQGRPMNWTDDGDFEVIEKCPDCWAERKIQLLKDESRSRYTGELPEALVDD